MVQVGGAAIQQRILSLYSAGSETEAYNISEIARKTGAAYPHVHAAVQRLITQQVLIEYKFGNSRYCRVNLNNDVARALLTQANLILKAQQMDTPNLRNLDEEIKQLAIEEPRLLAAIYQYGKLRFLVSDKDAIKSILQKTGLINITFNTPQEFREEILAGSASLTNAIILHGCDTLLLNLSPIQDQLFLNYSRFFRKEVIV